MNTTTLTQILDRYEEQRRLRATLDDQLYLSATDRARLREIPNELDQLWAIERAERVALRDGAPLLIQDLRAMPNGRPSYPRLPIYGGAE